MSPITMSGSLTTLSTNGDGPQLLTKAAEFLNALAQMGVQMAVEINLRPVGAETATYTPPARIVEHVSDSGAFLATIGAPPFSAGEPANPTPAAPAHPDAPLLLLPWRKLSREQRHALLHAEGRLLTKQLGHMLTMAEWDTYKPAEYPTASALPKTFGETWATLAWSWTRESV